MSPLILLLLLPILFYSFRIILTLTGWLVWLLCVVAMIAAVLGLIAWGITPTDRAFTANSILQLSATI